MTNIQFYVIETDNPAEQLSYALQLVLQQLALGKHLHVHTTGANATRELTRQFAETLGNNDERVVIDHRGEPTEQRDVLLNLSDEVPHFFSSFNSTLEIICKHSNTSETGRERYRFYRSRGYPLRHSTVSPQLAL